MGMGHNSALMNDIMQQNDVNFGIPSSNSRVIRRRAVDLGIEVTVKKGRTAFLSHYTLKRRLGVGGFGRVYEARRLSDWELVVVKTIRTNRVPCWCLLDGQLLPIEVVLLQMCRNIPGIVRLFEVYQFDEAWVLVMNHCSKHTCDLFDLIGECGSMSERRAAHCLYQLVGILLSSHKVGVLHRDIKDENILIDRFTDEMTLIDFGSGAFLDSGLYVDFDGTRVYSPPEWILNNRYDGKSAEIWSVGVLLYDMLCGDIPFSNDKAIISGKLHYQKTTLSPCARSLIEWCLNMDPKNRPTLLQILKHDWMVTHKPRHFPPATQLALQAIELGLTLQSQINQVSVLSNGHSKSIESDEDNDHILHQSINNNNNNNDNDGSTTSNLLNTNFPTNRPFDSVFSYDSQPCYYASEQIEFDLISEVSTIVPQLDDHDDYLYSLNPTSNSCLNSSCSSFQTLNTNEEFGLKELKRTVYTHPSFDQCLMASSNPAHSTSASPLPRIHSERSESSLGYYSRSDSLSSNESNQLVSVITSNYLRSCSLTTPSHTSTVMSVSKIKPNPGMDDFDVDDSILRGSTNSWRSNSVHSSPSSSSNSTHSSCSDNLNPSHDPTSISQSPSGDLSNLVFINNLLSLTFQSKEDQISTSSLSKIIQLPPSCTFRSTDSSQNRYSNYPVHVSKTCPFSIASGGLSEWLYLNKDTCPINQHNHVLFAQGDPTVLDHS